MPDGIKRPVTLSSEAFTSVRVTNMPQPVTPMGGGMASRVEHVIGHRHEFTDADGHWIATAYCEPEVAQIMLAAINAADPRAALQAMTDVEGPTAEEAVEDCRAAQRALGNDLTDAEMHEAEEQAAMRTFAERYPNVEALAALIYRHHPLHAMKRAEEVQPGPGVWIEQEEPGDGGERFALVLVPWEQVTGAHRQACIDAATDVLAALGIEVRTDG